MNNDIRDYKKPTNNDNNQRPTNREQLKKFIQQIKVMIKQDKRDVKLQLNQAGIHSFGDLVKFLKHLYIEFPKGAQKLIKNGLIVSLVIFILFALIGIFTLSISDIILGILFGIIGVVITDVIAIRTYPIITKTFRK